MTAVSVRIPRALDKVWGAAEEHPWMTATAAVTAAAGVFAFLRPSIVAGLVFAYLTFTMGATWQQGLIGSLRSRNGELDGRNAALEARLLQLEAGEAAASTMEIRHIGDLGETR